MARYKVKSLYVAIPYETGRMDRFGNKLYNTYRLDRGDVFGTAKSDKEEHTFTKNIERVEELAEGGFLEKLDKEESVSAASAAPKSTAASSDEKKEEKKDDKQ